MTHRNAPLIPTGRARMVELVITHGWPHGWTQRRAAERFQVAPATVNRWVSRARRGEGLSDRSSRPRRCPHQLPVRTQRRIITLRFPPVGPTPYRLPPRCRALHHAETRLHRPRHRACRCAQHHQRAMNAANPGDMIQIDTTKLGRIPGGGGWRVHGRGCAQDRRAGRARNAQRQAGAPAGRGSSYLHHAIDDYSRMVYSEILTDEKKDTGAGFMQRACAFFSAHGVEVTRVMTDNGACYRSTTFNAAPGHD